MTNPEILSGIRTKQEEIERARVIMKIISHPLDGPITLDEETVRRLIAEERASQSR